jgi:hypothetical protein
LGWGCGLCLSIRLVQFLHAPPVSTELGEGQCVRRTKELIVSFLTKLLAILFELQHICGKRMSTLTKILVFRYPLLPILPESLTGAELIPPYLRLKPTLLLWRAL